MMMYCRERSGCPYGYTSVVNDEEWEQNLVAGTPCRRHVLKSLQPVRCVLIVDRAVWVELQPFVFEHPRSKFNDPNTGKC